MSSRSGRVYADDYGGERWDRARFERVRARSRGPAAEEKIRVEEFDRYPDRQDLRIEVDDGRRGSRARRRQSEVVVDDEEIYSPSRRRQPPMEEERISITGREVLPYRPRDRWDKESETPSRRPTRPMFARRQSSLDTYDRRPLPKFSNEERDINVSINVMPPPPPPEPRYRDRDYWYRDEPPRDVRVRREVEREIIRSPERAPEVEESSDSFEEVEVPVRSPKTQKRGKTRMPKRLVHRAALIQLGYSFDEEEDFFVVRQALAKEQIDIVIKISESYFNDNKVVYKFQDQKLLEAPAPPPPRSSISSSATSISPTSNPFEVAPPPVDVIETITTKIIENPTAEDFAEIERGRSEHKSIKSGSSSRSSSSTATERPPPGRTVVAELRAADPPVVVPTRSRSVARSAKSSRAKSAAGSESDEESALVVAPSRRKSVRERDIKAEIRALEAEQRRLEKEERRQSEASEVVENRDKSTIVRVEKDKRGRLSLVRPAR